MLQPNTILRGRYRVIQKLGEGGMGAVYEAVDETFDTPIALKEIIFETVDEEQKRRLAAAFEREAKALAKARHEAVPFVRDYFSEGDRQYLLMELIEGDDLAVLLSKNKKPFELTDIAEWMRQLLDALDYLHNLKPRIIHRDIKPHNLKVTRKRLKLLDFGIAKSSETAFAGSSSQTFMGATMNYSPIEQLLHVIPPTFREFILLKHQANATAVLAQTTDARADIYALGATFYHLLTNCLPQDAAKRTLDIWEGKPDPLLHPSDLNASVPRPFGDILIKAMAVERDDRFETAAAMLETLENLPLSSKSPIKPTEAETVPLIDKPVEVADNSSSSNRRPATVPAVPPGPPAVTEPLVRPAPVNDSKTAPTDWRDSRPYLRDTQPNKPAELESPSQPTVPAKAASDLPQPVFPVKRFLIVSAAAGTLVMTMIGGAVLLGNGSGGASNALVNNRIVESTGPATLPGTVVTNSSSLVEQCVAFLNAKNYDAALRECSKAIENTPQDPIAFYDRAIAYTYEKDYNAALRDYSEAIRLNPQYSNAYYGRGLIHADKNENDAAIRDYSEAIRLDPQNSGAYFNRGTTYADKKNYDMAIRDYSEAIRLNPQYSKAFDARGRVYEAKKDYDAAIRDYAEAIVFNPQFGDAYQDRGDANAAKKNYDAAIQDYSEAIGIDPQNASAYYDRGIVYDDQKNYDAAILDYSKAIELDPKDADAYWNRAIEYDKKGEKAKATEDRKKYAELKKK